MKLHFSCFNIDFMTSTSPNQTSTTPYAKKDILHTRNPPHQTSTTPCVKLDIDHTRPPPHRTSTTPHIYHTRHPSRTVCKKGNPPHQTLNRLDIHHTMCKIGHPAHHTSSTPDIQQTRHPPHQTFITQCVKKTSTTPNIHHSMLGYGAMGVLFYTQCIVCLVCWTFGMVDVWCGGCLCGVCRTINSNLYVPLSTTADPLAHAVQDA